MKKRKPEGRRRGHDRGPRPEPRSRLEGTRGSRAILPALAGAALVAAVAVFNTALSMSGDNAEFIILARSIVQGQGLTYINAIHPIPATKYPFGFPLILAAVEWVAPGNIVAMKTLVALIFATIPPLVYIVVRKAAGPAVALGIALFTVCSAPLLNFSSQVMSEVPAAAISLFALWRLQKAVDGSVRDLILLIFALAAAYYVRSASIALAAAAGGTFLLRREGRRALIVTVGFAALIAPWMIRNALLGGNSYIGQLLSVDPYRPEMGRIGILGLLERVGVNLQTYFQREVPRIFDPGLAAVDPVWVGPLLGLLLAAAVLTGLRRAEPVAVYIACYFGVHLLWPQVWSDLRFLLPALPLIAFLVVDGLARAIRSIGPLAPHAGKAVAAVLILSTFGNIAAARTLRQNAGKYPIHFQRYIDAARWIGANTPKETIVCCRKGFLMSVFSERRATVYVFSEDPAEVISGLERDQVNVVVVDQLGFSSTPRYLLPAVQGNTDRFALLHTTGEPKNWVLAFTRGPRN